MENMVRYLEENFGLHCQLMRFSHHEEAILPLYLKSSFEMYHGDLAGHNLVWAKPIEREDITPDQLQKYGEQLRRILETPVVFIFNKLESWKRKRLIEKQVGFIQPFKQLYIPDLLLQLNDVIRNEDKDISTGKLTMPAQCALLYHLQVNSLEGIPFREIATQLSYSTMTVSRIIKELNAFELLSVEGSREKSIRFNWQGRTLWEKGLALLSSPVREVWFTNQMRDDSSFRLSGDTALAGYTMLAEGRQLTYAIGKEEFRIIRAENVLPQLDRRDGNNRIEVWEYDPTVLSGNKEVDRLSLYLSMSDEEDERVIRSLQDLIDEIKW